MGDFMGDFLEDELGRDADELIKAMPRDQQIKTLADLCSTQINLEEEVIDLEARLADAKDRLKGVSEGRIPELMGQLGVKHITLSDGHQVSIKPYVDAHSSDEVVQWLAENGHGDIVKGEVKAVFPKGFDIDVIRKIAAFIAQNGLSPETKETVHYQTLCAWCREAIANGTPFPADIFRFYQGFKTTIK